MCLGRTLRIATIFAIACVASTALLAGKLLRISCYSPCTDPRSVEKVLPLLCGKLTRIAFFETNGTIYARIANASVPVAVRGDVVDRNLWIVLEECCNRTHPPSCSVSLHSVVRLVSISASIGALVSLLVEASYVVARRRRSGR